LAIGNLGYKNLTISIDRPVHSRMMVVPPTGLSTALTTWPPVRSRTVWPSMTFSSGPSGALAPRTASVLAKSCGRRRNYRRMGNGSKRSVKCQQVNGWNSGRVNWPGHGQSNGKEHTMLTWAFYWWCVVRWICSRCGFRFSKQIKYIFATWYLFYICHYVYEI